MRDENGDLVASVNIRHAKKGGFREPLMDDALRVGRRIAAVSDMEAIVKAVAGCVRYRAPDACGECIGCRAAAALRKAGRL